MGQVAVFVEVHFVSWRDLCQTEEGPNKVAAVALVGMFLALIAGD